MPQCIKFVFFALLFISACPTTLFAQNSPIIKVESGTLEGAEADGIRYWLGVPYAAPPVGQLRWRSPQPVVAWNNVKKVQHFAPACAQQPNWFSNIKSEDCLYLNVWAPAKANNLPVIVWIHGGGYFGGTGAQPLYNGTRLARHGAIVVTINYRLGIFGFFAHPTLKSESPFHTSGNQGIEDQIAALRWVKRNIAAFGGDPQRVTVMGESAGAESVAVLVASPLTKNLFQRAIAQSGNAALPINPSENPLFSRENVEVKSLTFADGIDAKTLDALRELSTETILAPPWSPRPIADGYVLKEDQTGTYLHKRQHDVPLLVGWTAQEGKDLAPEILGTTDFTQTQFVPLATKLLGYSPSAMLLAAYPANSDSETAAAVNQLTNDWWGWRMWYWARLHAKHGSANTYVYYFAHYPA